MSKFNPLKFIADNPGLNIADAINKSYQQGRTDSIEEFADLMLEKLPNNMDKTFACGEIALLICGVEEQLKGESE